MADRSAQFDWITNTFTVASGATYDMVVTGTFFRITAGTAPIGVRVDGTGSVKTIEEGMGWRSPGPAFSRLQFENATGSAITITVQAGWGDFIDQRTSILNQPVQVAPRGAGSYGVTAVTVTTTETTLRALSSTPEMVVLQNDGATDVFYGGNAVAAFLLVHGQRLQPGERHVIRGSEVTNLTGCTAAASAIVRVLAYVA